MGRPLGQGLLVPASAASNLPVLIGMIEDQESRISMSRRRLCVNAVINTVGYRLFSREQRSRHSRRASTQPVGMRVAQRANRSSQERAHWIMSWVFVFSMEISSYNGIGWIIHPMLSIIGNHAIMAIV
jgi:hypothetical protein